MFNEFNKAKTSNVVCDNTAFKSGSDINNKGKID
jgi:hypothetical protein